MPSIFDLERKLVVFVEGAHSNPLTQYKPVYNYIQLCIFMAIFRKLVSAERFKSLCDRNVHGTHIYNYNNVCIGTILWKI